MNLKLLFVFLFLAVLFMPAQLKPKHKKHKGKHHGLFAHGHGGPPGHRVPKHKKHAKFQDIIQGKYNFYIIFALLNDDDDDEEHDDLDWFFDFDTEGQCNPNPCLNNGVCKEKRKNKYKCECPKPFKGRKCEKGPKYCRKGKCGRGECVLTPNPPYYECKCKLPFQPPHCRSFSTCEPSPCKNGGTCIRDGNDFDCQCPEGYTGRYCHVGPDDCYTGEGESYRGNVSETEDGDECLYWNSHFILEHGSSPYTSFEDEDGLGPHNFCRNPDGDTRPWCFIRRGRRLSWDYCNIAECSEPTDVMPTHAVPPTPQPTTPQPTPSVPQPKPTEPQPKPTEPQPKPTEPQPKPTEPQPKPTEPQPNQLPTTTSVPVIVPLTTEAPSKQFATCGIPQPKRKRIFQGWKVSPGKLPWQVSVQVKNKGSYLPYAHICGGVLIESCWVLTAGHCLEPDKDMQVVLGEMTLFSQEPTKQILHVEKAIRHENYRETPSTVYNDIALLKLKGTNGVCANETQYVKTACLPDAQLPDGTDCKISGWGVTENSSFGSITAQADVTLINQEKCSEKNIYGSSLDSSMFCAGHLQGGADACQGDSGGPLTCMQNNVHVVYGLVSWGDECGKANKPGVYTRVTQFHNWIKSKIQETSA
ncbi:hyaluronan-binding protein 2-like [Thalassophryne amazonica]|uniref:hyaluronan-binding protein 2-like n=1 Tax=Thalassophryne amazonica TaxID=390379 RepID=UPI001471DBD7|nr:hyaluronan-binding protein 2-like [Thalassophryne amazonica]